jgi:hypothetical protein
MVLQGWASPTVWIDDCARWLTTRDTTEMKGGRRFNLSPAMPLVVCVLVAFSSSVDAETVFSGPHCNRTPQGAPCITPGNSEAVPAYQSTNYRVHFSNRCTHPVELYSGDILIGGVPANSSDQYFFPATARPTRIALGAKYTKNALPVRHLKQLCRRLSGRAALQQIAARNRRHRGWAPRPTSGLLSG